jgi:DNA-binding ferritin-like protein
MQTTETLIQRYEDIVDNPIDLDRATAEPIVEGLNIFYASFLALYLQYQKHHFVVEGAEFYMLHEYFSESYEEVQNHAHDLGERLNGLGGVPVSTFGKLAALCCFEPESDDVYRGRAMVEHDLVAEQAMINLIRRFAGQAESVSDRSTRYLYEQILIKTEERAYHLAHFLAQDSLKIVE